MKKITFLVAALCTTMFASAAITLPLTENFAECTKGSAATSGSTMPEITVLTPYTWAASFTKVYDAGGMVKLGTSSVTGKFVTAPITATLDSVIVEFDAIGWTGTADVATKKVTYGTTTVEITTPAAAAFPITAASLQHFRVAFAKVADATLTVEGGALKSRFFLDNLSITETVTVTPPVGIDEVTSMSVYANNGTIYGAENGRIYTILGMDVTEQNGNLNGIYVVKVGNKTQKIAVK